MVDQQNTRMCTGCGRQIPAEYNVCPHCGRPQNVPQGPQPYGQQPYSQQPYGQQPVEKLGLALTIILYLVSFFIWPAGILIGIIWGGVGSDSEKKHIGKNCLILGILGLVVECILVVAWGYFAVRVY